jgi:hypothetical protein
MSEIMGKFASSMSGFWWSLDDQERRLLVYGVLYLAALVVAIPMTKARDQKRQDELADAVAERLAARG